MSDASVVAAMLPDPGSPVFVPVMGFIGGLLGAAWAKASSDGPEAVREAAQDASLLWGAAALLIYLFGLVTNLY